jgi:hypothetical protein
MPDDAAPKSFRSSAVRFGRTVSSMSFWRNAASYCPRPRLRSQTTMSIMKPKLRLGAYHRRSARERSQGENDVLAQVPVRTWVRTRRMRAPFKAAWIIPDHPAGLFSCWLFSGKASAGYFCPYSPRMFRTSNHASDLVLSATRQPQQCQTVPPGLTGLIGKRPR